MKPNMRVAAVVVAGACALAAGQWWADEPQRPACGSDDAWAVDRTPLHGFEGTPEAAADHFTATAGASLHLDPSRWEVLARDAHEATLRGRDAVVTLVGDEANGWIVSGVRSCG